MLQKIAAICAIISFVSGIYTTFADNPKWQRYSLFGFALLCFVAWFIDRKYGRTKQGKVITLNGKYSLPHPHKDIEAEIFYPKPFKHTPNLTIRFPERKMIAGRPVPGSAHNGLPGYEFMEQRPDGFKIKVLTLSVSYYKPVIEWKARGLSEGKD